MKKQTPSKLSRETVLQVLKKGMRPLALGEIAEILALQRNQARELKGIVNGLARDGLIMRLKNGRFGIPQEMNLQTGTLWCTKSGNGFLVPDKEGVKDIFIPSKFIQGAFHGDRVIARVEHSWGGKKEGKIVKVVERKTRNVVGFIKKIRETVFLVPEDQRISHHFIVQHDKGKDRFDDGDLVAARVTSFPEEGGHPGCKVLKVFKGLEDVSSIIQYVQYKYGLPSRFRKDLEAQAQSVAAMPPDPGRLDLRGKKHVTIDGEFAKDFDDAVCLEKGNGGYTLYVSIADVAHYVTPGSGLNEEAYKRGTSVYFPGTVIPMLPKVLSNGVCSLNPLVDRLALTVKLEYSLAGDLSGASFHESVIRSAMRLTYTEVAAALSKKEKAARSRLKGLLRQLGHMEELASMLTKKREARGTLDFDLPEPEVILNIEGGVQDILRAERLFSHKLIEEFMIAANEAVARFLEEKGKPAVYRIHEPPEREKLRDLEGLLRTLSIDYDKSFRGASSLQQVLAKVKGKDYEFLVNRILLRSMKQARYSAANKGHYGLASEAYLHFTSPIRRYPDLICHRVLKNLLRGKPIEYTQTQLEHMAIHLSDRERVAMDVEREIEDRIRILFMSGKIGEEYEGIISHITSYGFIVELFDIFVEGIVLLADLCNDYYIFQEEKFRLIGRRTKKVFRIGDKVKVRVLTANVVKNQLHFSLI